LIASDSYKVYVDPSLLNMTEKETAYLIKTKKLVSRNFARCFLTIEKVSSQQEIEIPWSPSFPRNYVLSSGEPLVKVSASEEPQGGPSYSLRFRKIAKLEQAIRSLLVYLRKTGRSSSPLEIIAKARALIRREGIAALFTKLESSVEDSYRAWVIQYDSPSSQDVANAEREIASFHRSPLISFVMPVHNPEPRYLKEAIESVLDQVYPQIELVICDDGSTHPSIKPLLESFASSRANCKVIFSEKNQHISQATNTAIQDAMGEYLAFIDHDDLVSPLAAYHVAKALQTNPEAKILYTDEDKVDASGKRFDPYFKPDWNPILLRSQNYINHLTVIDSNLVKAVGRLREGFEGAQDWDLLFRASEKIDHSKIVHIPKVLYHWRVAKSSTARNPSVKDYVFQAQRQAIAEHCLRLGIDAELSLEKNLYWRLHYSQEAFTPLVSIIIPTKDQADYLKRCVESIDARTKNANYELLIINNGSENPDILAYFELLRSKPYVRVLDFDQPFNFSKINNFAASQAAGDYLLLLNNDVEILNSEWLAEMLSYASMPQTGAVGAKLYYPNGLIQHAGVILGIGGVAGHIYLNKPHQYAGQMNRAKLAQNISAVTGACLLVSKKKYFEAGGLNEDDLAIAFNDIDFCLKLMEHGYKNVWTPFAELTHYESASRGLEDSDEKLARFEAESAYMKKRWGSLLQADPAYNPNLTLSRQDASPAFPPRS